MGTEMRRCTRSGPLVDDTAEAAQSLTRPHTLMIVPARSFLGRLTGFLVELVPCAPPVRSSAAETFRVALFHAYAAIVGLALGCSSAAHFLQKPQCALLSWLGSPDQSETLALTQKADSSKHSQGRTRRIRRRRGARIGALTTTAGAPSSCSGEINPAQARLSPRSASTHMARGLAAGGAPCEPHKTV